MRDFRLLDFHNEELSVACLDLVLVFDVHRLLSCWNEAMQNRAGKPGSE